MSTSDKRQMQERHAVEWLEGDVPISSLFDDPFYSRQDGRDEAAYVFVDGNGLPGRWQGVTRFDIAELGFGTGLNFLETWRQWIGTREPGQCLRFTSFERFPLPGDDIARAIGVWPELSGLAVRLLEAWRDGGGAGAVWRLDPATELRVIGEPAEQSVAGWEGAADAWYLDGFSPAKNPDMWSAELMAAVGRHTRPEGTLATYTSAGWVRRNLQAAGFSVAKRAGHGRKREMVVGTYRGDAT